MTVLAGQLLRAGEQQPATPSESRINSALTLTTTYQDVPNATETFTTVNANAKALAIGVFDFSVTAAIGASGLALGQLVVDGVAITNENAILDANQVIRGTVMQSWVVDLPAAGSHTLKLQAQKNINAGAVAMSASAHSTLNVVVFDFDYS